MAGKPKIDRALPDIESFFDGLAPEPMPFREICRIYAAHRDAWQLPASLTARRFLNRLAETSRLKKVTMEFPQRLETRYVWGEVSVPRLALSVRPKGYFTHYTAMGLHDLTDQLPSTLYLNTEQSPKPRQAAPLAQGRIDAAFRRKPRLASNRAQCMGKTICLLNGMNTGKLGVTALLDADGLSLPVTDIERTLIDIAVRPFYAGGVFEVLRAYQAASQRVNLLTLASYLKQMGHVYPYHQAIGFYLDRAGTYPSSDIEILASMPQEFDFHLTYGIKTPSYSEKWRLFFPQGL